MQVFKKEIYTLYLNQLKKLDCKLLISKIKAGNLYKVYRGKTTTFVIETMVEKTSGVTENWYRFSILSNYDYDDDYED